MRWMGIVGLMGCNGGATDVPSASQMFVSTNSADGAKEGHTPRGFEGQGTGIFTGDEINPGFPATDGVQIFLTLPLDPGLAGFEVVQALISGDPAEVQGAPFDKLGDLELDEMRFMAFGHALWDRQPVDGGVHCVYAASVDGPYGCEITAAVQRAIDDGRAAVQVRLRFEQAANADGISDMVMFHAGDTNATAPNLFEVEIEAR